MPSQPEPERDFAFIHDLLRSHARERPRHTALVMGEEALDYGGLDAMMDRIAASLQRDGIRSGDTVAICAATSLPYAATFLGSLRAGAVVVPLAPSASAESLARMVNDCGARLLFLDAAVAGQLAGVSLPDPVRWVSLDEGSGGDPFSRWLAASGASVASAPADPDAAFNIIYSSGTTGEPKGIVQSHRMRWAHVRRGSAYGYDRAAVTLCSTPLYSNTTLVSFFPTLAGGGTVVLMPKFDAAGFLELAERRRVTHAMLVPVQYQRVMALPDFERFDLSAFHTKFCTSAPFAAALKADVLRRWPGGLVEFYGMTEGGGTCILPAHDFPDKLATVGRPAEGHEIRLIDDVGRELPEGAVGEVVGRSMAMMTGYHNQPHKTAEAEWYDDRGRRFIRTGDLGRFDEDGFLTLTDRKKDLIISGGFNVYPSDLEAILLQHPAVIEAAAVGVPSPEWGETPIAFVVLRPGRPEGGEDVRSWANQRLGRTQRLKDVQVVASLPRSAIGKVLKRELRDTYARQGGAEVTLRR